jgi:hypothetical protein
MAWCSLVQIYHHVETASYFHLQYRSTEDGSDEVRCITDMPSSIDYTFLFNCLI